MLLITHTVVIFVCDDCDWLLLWLILWSAVRGMWQGDSTLMMRWLRPACFCWQFMECVMLKTSKQRDKQTHEICLCLRFFLWPHCLTIRLLTIHTNYFSLITPLSWPHGCLSFLNSLSIFHRKEKKAWFLPSVHIFYPVLCLCMWGERLKGRCLCLNSLVEMLLKKFKNRPLLKTILATSEVRTACRQFYQPE